MPRPIIVTIKNKAFQSEALKDVLLKALVDRGVDVVMVGSRAEAMGPKVALIGAGSVGRTSMAEALIGLMGTPMGGPMGMDTYKITQPTEYLIAAPLLDHFEYNPDVKAPKNFMHNTPPVAKKQGNNRKRNKYRRK